jgi:hypothetical protein
MIAPVFAPLAAIVALWRSATMARSLAPQCVLGCRAVSGGAVNRAGDVTLTAVEPERSCAAASGSAARQTRQPSGAHVARCGPALWPGAKGGHDQPPARVPAREPWRAHA